MDLSKDYNLLTAQANVALMCGVDYGGEIITTHVAEMAYVKNKTIPLHPVKRDFDIKLERKMELNDLWGMVNRGEKYKKVV